MRTIRLMILSGVFLLGATLGGPVAVAQEVAAVQVRVDIAGDWLVMTHEDQPTNGPGPELGDYGGLPLNEAARQKAETWDASILSQQERQAQTHPVQYVGNNRGPNRITKILDPVTQQMVGYAMAGGFGRADRVVWTDGRPHPSDYSEHTWSGYSTGKWENGAFVVTTTHLKVGAIRRNGVYSSPYVKLVEYFVRSGTEMDVFEWIEDPMTLDEPMIRTYMLRWNPNGNTAAPAVFESVEEVDEPLGWVPSLPIGTKHHEFADKYKIPFEATQGGPEGLYPEYQIKLRNMLRQGSK